MVRCYSFYSYKGGSGRTTTMLNTVKHLVRELGANPKRPILLVDADLESAGLTYYFQCERRFDREFSSTRVMKVFEEVFKGSEIPYILNRAEEEYLKFNTPMIGFNKAEELDKYDVHKDFSKVLGEVYLSERQASFLMDILSESIKQQCDKDYVMKYRGSKGNIWVLKDALQKIDSEDIPQEEKDAKKTSLVDDFLPCRRFLDVTEYFTTVDDGGTGDLEPNTILFLGTDVSSEERVPRIDAQKNINNLLDLLDSNGYSAVIFDSGSGTQASAIALHSTSDVIVYCLRPTIQFVRATRDNIISLYDTLMVQRSMLGKPKTKSSIIMFPNAVPLNEGRSKLLGNESFSVIQTFVEHYDELIDGEFCYEDKCLHEVPLFKWREKILGCKEMHAREGTDLYDIMDAYSHTELPDDVKDAVKVYSNLAKSLVNNS